MVVDEAYGEFRRAGTPSALELLPEHRNLVVSRTMSKAFALAGARLGYLAAAPEICDAIRVVRLPYHLSAVTQATALAALRHAPELLGRVDDLRAERDETVGWLREQGLEVADSDANFALFGRFADRHAVWQGLLDRGVLIRETGPDGWLRVSIGTAEEMAGVQAGADRGHGGGGMSRVAKHGPGDQGVERPRRGRPRRHRPRRGRAPASASTTTCSPPSPGTRWST